MDVHMAAMELLCFLAGINPLKLSKEETYLLEAELFSRVCDELKEFFRDQHKEYFKLMNYSVKKENDMLEANFIQLIIRDILASGEYNLRGISFYIGIHEDIVQEVLDGRNTSPSAILLRRSIDLHRSVRRDLYDSIFKKVTLQECAKA